MKISTRGRYGLLAMIVLARRHGCGPISIKKIVQTQGLSHSYLEQILSPLRRAGLVRSVRGPEGGYHLSRSPADISVGDVLRVLEGPLVPVDCVDRETDEQVCERQDACSARPVWVSLRDSLTDVVDSISLQDLAENAAGTKAGESGRLRDNI